MKNESENCVICAEEFNVNELKSIALSTFNITKFKICTQCFSNTDPIDDYASVRSIVESCINLEKMISKKS